MDENDPNVKYSFPLFSEGYSIIHKQKEVGRITREGEHWFLELPVGTITGGNKFDSFDAAKAMIDTRLEEWQRDDWPHAPSARVVPAFDLAPLATQPHSW